VALSRQRVRGAPLDFILKVILAVYIAAAALLPLAHHDIACHFKSSTHCTSCVIGSAGDLASNSTSAGHPTLNRDGRPATLPDERIDSLSTPAASGRAPPSITDARF
jgi:hypothetical protein